MWHAQTMANRRRRNNVGANEIANAIHRMVDAMQPVVAQLRMIIPPVKPVTMEDFMLHTPAKFTSKATPDEADTWLRECEKIFWVIECTKAKKLTFATFLLVTDVEYWWMGMQQQMQTREKEVIWINFRKRFQRSTSPIALNMSMESSSSPCSRGI